MDNNLKNHEDLQNLEWNNSINSPNKENEERWREGDVIYYVDRSTGYITFRQIIHVREKDYGWIYPDYPDKGMEPFTGYDSCNSSDPMLLFYNYVGNAKIDNRIIKVEVDYCE